MAEWLTWFEYTKHKPPRGSSCDAVIGSTEPPQPSRYFSGVDIRELEERAAREGIAVPSGKPATAYKVFDAGLPIGASNGEETSCLRVESTNGVFHGHPISRSKYEQYLRRRS